MPNKTMTFGVDILPQANNNFYLGGNSLLWNGSYINNLNASYLTSGTVPASVLPVATTNAIGGIQLGYTASGKNYPVELSSNQAYVNVPWTDTIFKQTPNTTTKYYVSGSSAETENSSNAIFDTAIYVENSVLMGAAWNDYAEYRHTEEEIEPGRCVIETGNDSLILSTKRLQGGAEIVSDTFGFSIGKTAHCNTPIAISGRVLAYLYEELSEFKIGMPVCSGPNGTVSIMTEQEARDYPWVIIGTVSSIPQEQTWGEKEIQVNNRIWIRVR